jgi:Uma2 family endonuclease
MTTRTRTTLEEFLAIPDFDERRLELIDGEVWEKPMPNWGHSTIQGELYHLLRPFGYGGVEPRAIIPASGNFDASSPVPDFAFFLDQPPPGNDWMRQPPLIAAEVLSPGQSRREMHAKVALYQEFGVRSVWVFDPERREVEVYEDGGRRILADSDTLTTPYVPGLAIDLGALFDRA